MTFHKRIAKWLEKHKDSVRLFLAVVAGIVVAMVLSLITRELLYFGGILPPLGKPMFATRLVGIELLFHSFFAVIAACVTASLAGDKAQKAAFLLGTKEAIMWLIGILLLWKDSPHWYNLAKALLGIPLAILGGYIYRRFLQKPKVTNGKQVVPSP